MVVRHAELWGCFNARCRGEVYKQAMHHLAILKRNMKHVEEHVKHVVHDVRRRLFSPLVGADPGQLPAARL